MENAFNVSNEDVLSFTKDVSDYDAYITMEVYNKELGVNITYEFIFNATNKKEYYLENVTAEFNIDSKWYDIIVWGNDHYYVPGPTK